MPDNEAEVRIKASGAPETRDAVKSVSDVITDLAGRSKLAAGDLVVFETVLRGDAQAGIELTTSLEALAAAKGQVSEATRAAASEALAYVATLGEEAVASEAAAAAENTHAAALEKVASSSGLARIGARALIQEVGGPLSFVMGQVASQSALLAPLLEAAFPIIAAAGLVEILVSLYEKFTKVSEEAKHATEETNKLAREIQQVGRRIQEIDDKRFRLVYGEVAAKAREAAEETERGGKAGASLAFLQLTALRQAAEIQKDLAKGVTIEQAGSASSNYSDSLKKKIAAYEATKRAIEKAQLEQNEAEAKSGELSLESLTKQGEQRKKQTDKENSEAKTAANERRAAQIAELNGELTSSAIKARIAQSSGEIQSSIAHGVAVSRIEAVQNVESREIQLAQEEVRFAEQRAAETAAIDRKALTEALAIQAKKREIAAGAKNPDQAISDVDRQTDELRAQFALKDLVRQEALAKAKGNLARVAVEAERKALDEIAADGEKTEARIEKATAKDTAEKRREAAKQVEDQRRANAEAEAGEAQHQLRLLALRRDAVESSFRLHRINASQRLLLLTAIEAEETRLAREALERERDYDAKTLAQKQLIQNKINALDDAAAARKQKDTAKEILTLEQQWNRYFAVINRGVQTSFDSWIRGQRTLGQSTREMLGNLVADSANALLQMSLKRAEHELFTRIQHITTNETIVASDAVAASQSTSISAVSSLKKLAHSATVAAGRAYEALAGIPIIGPALGAAAAAGTFAAVLGFGSLISAEGGAAEIPGTVGAILHAKEMVLPAELAERVRSMTNPGGGGGFTNHGGITVNAGAGANGRQIGRDLYGELRSQMRRRNLSPA